MPRATLRLSFMETVMSMREREALWKGRVEQWRASGQSQRAFALEHGYSPRQMSYWLQRTGAGTMAPVAKLLPVTVKVNAPTLPALTLCSPGGWRITVPADLPPQVLTELLRCLP